MKRRDFIIYSAILGSSTLKVNDTEARDGLGCWRVAAPLPINTQELYPAVHKGKLYVAGGIASKLGVIYFTDDFR